ncbi:hypothetical protein ADL21_00215 [Streptomyces albus subsp. albus]|nr:hypothetical protein ADL21_00215 [Streptomyces albus subsp. albus]
MTQRPAGISGNRFDHRAVAWWRIRLAVLFAAVIAVLVLHAAVPGLFKLGGPWLVVLSASVVALAVPTVLLLPKWWFEVHRWDVSDVAVSVRTGYFWQRTRRAPLCRIQAVDTVRGPLRRRLGLATVTITTASANGTLKIDLGEAQAAEVARQLTRATGTGPTTG